MASKISSEEKQYLWEHFIFNAEQRLKAFNFFVVFAIFANGGVFAAVKNESSNVVFLLIGIFISVLSITFWLIDKRSAYLLNLAKPGLQSYEQNFSPDGRLFIRDEAERHPIARFTVAFRILFGLEFVFGAGVMLYALVSAYCAS